MRNGVGMGGCDGLAVEKNIFYGWRRKLFRSWGTDDKEWLGNDEQKLPCVGADKMGILVRCLEFWISS
jgi:hypothetical protein